MTQAGARRADTDRAAMFATFHAIADDTGSDMRAVIDLYLECTAEAMDRLSVAIAARSADEGARMAHTCAGSSQLCGIRRLGRLFECIETAARAGRFHRASMLCKWARTEFATVGAALLERDEGTGQP